MAESRRIERPSRRSLRVQTELRTAPRYSPKTPLHSPNWRQASESNAQGPKAHSASNRGGLPNAQACRGGAYAIRTHGAFYGHASLAVRRLQLDSANAPYMVPMAGLEPARDSF